MATDKPVDKLVFAGNPNALFADSREVVQKGNSPFVPF
jgi:hypothetical protein